MKQANQLFRMYFRVEAQSEANAASVDSLELWHNRLGHMNLEYFRNMVRLELVDRKSVV